MAEEFIVNSLQFVVPETQNPPTEVQNVGLSIIRLMPLSGGIATGIQANLQIGDEEALKVLEEHYSENRRLEWTFNFGGGADSVTVTLRWITLDSSNGTIQLAKTAVMRNLLHEATSRTASPSGDGTHQSKPTEPIPHRPRTSREPRRKASSSTGNV